MLIAVSGKMKSGKDTVAKMIQWLSSSYIQEKVPQIEDYVFSKRNHKILDQKWKIKRFADKLKDIVCLMIGCTREQLEDREFKEKPLGKEWDKWKIDQGRYLDPELEKEKYFSTAKECREFYDLHDDDEFLDDLIKVKMTPRKLMQLLGTEAGREILHPNIWVNALFADYKGKYLGSSAKLINPPIVKHHYEYPKWIIPDTRFPNEAKAIKNREGIVIRVERPLKLRFPEIHIEYGYDGPDIDKYLMSYIRREYPDLHEKLTHESETALDHYEDFDYILENSSSLEFLLEQVEFILKDEGII